MPTVNLWCGPTVVAAFTGQPFAAAEKALRDAGADPAAGVTPSDLAAGFATFGFDMKLAAHWETPFSSPGLLDWIEGTPPRRRQRRLLAVMLEQLGEAEGHVVAVWRDSICDSLSWGQSGWLRDSPHRDAFMSAVWSVWPPRGKWPTSLGPVRFSGDASPSGFP